MSREIRRFDVVFKDPSAIFKPGDVVAGQVQLELNAEIKIRGVKLFLQGISRVSWDEQKSYTKGSSSQVSNKNVDIYLDEPLMVLSRVEGNILKSGRYDWPFTVRLPPYVPSTYDGQFGKVMYWAKAVLDRPWKGDNEFTRPFTVLGQLDLNTETEARKPIEGISETQAGNMCFKAGPVSGHIALKQRGFTSGENIPFVVKISNKSTKCLKNVRVNLSQQVTFRANNQTRRQNTMLKGCQWRDVNAGEVVTWEDSLKNIPAAPPSRLGAGCKSIDVKYMVSLVAKPNPGVPLEVPVEVTIGTVPLRKLDAGTPMLTVKGAASRGLDPATTVVKKKASPMPPRNPAVPVAAGGK
jgi:hypothetical protein